MFKKSSRVLLVTLLLFVLAGSTYAFAATNTVDATFAGDGNNSISGYEVTAIQYSTLDGDITGVSFELDEAATTVQAAIGSGDPLSYTFSNLCTLDTGRWTCLFTSTVTVKEAINLRVIAVQ